MSTEQNKKTLQRYYDEIYNKGNLSVWEELMDKNYVSHAGSTEYKGLEGAKRLQESRKNGGAPDSKATIDELVAEGDTLAFRGMIKGTNKGETQGRPPTGKKFNRAFVGFYRFKNGKISEGWILHDSLSQLQQLGITQVPAPANPPGR
jgi:predicted ester cyclase